MILGISLLLLCSYVVWKGLLSVLVVYLRAGVALGFDKVGLLYKPLTGSLGLLEWSSQKYGHSYGFYFEAIRKNPMLKIMIIKLSIGYQLLVLDAEMIKKMSNEFHKHLVKPNFMIFSNEIDQGLVFSEKELWRKSRTVISELFHF